ncbi:energy transducer TonB [Kerstersia gyiorum]|uniref:energy transducer TonB n=2 Tax=Kerstersia gyiorum TaxID=206506 RepID=UPI00083999CF|nr:energy transducer TonB [Kerstersia gyiorum]
MPMPPVALRFYRRSLLLVFPLLASGLACAQDTQPTLAGQTFRQAAERDQETDTQQSSSLAEANALMDAERYDDAVHLLERILYQTNIHYAPSLHKADLYHALGTAYHHVSRSGDARRALLFADTLYRNLNTEPLIHAALLAELAQIEAEAAAGASDNQAAIQTHSTLQAGYLRKAIILLGTTPAQAHLSQMADLTCQLAELYQTRKKPENATKLRQRCMQARSRHAQRNIGTQQQAMLGVLATLADPEDWNDPNPADPIVSKPAISNQVTPDYPAIARRMGQEGIVEILVRLDDKGKPDGIAIAATSGHARLDDAAIAAVRQWQFTPARTKSGKAVESALTIPITFVLKRSMVPVRSNPAAFDSWPPSRP